MKTRLIFLAWLAIPVTVVAQMNDSYTCTMGDATRRVVIEREGSAPVPCEVAYYKDTEAPGEREVLWNAQNDASYCGERSADFVSQLEGWGWQCDATEPEATREEDDPGQ